MTVRIFQTDYWQAQIGNGEIGPHVGRELPLLLNGSKPLALYDAPNGIFPPEIQAAIDCGSVLAACERVSKPNANGVSLHHVILVKAENAALIERFRQLNRQIAQAQTWAEYEEYERQIGLLLGYSADDTETYLVRNRRYRYPFAGYRLPDRYTLRCLYRRWAQPRKTKPFAMPILSRIFSLRD